MTSFLDSLLDDLGEPESEQTEEVNTDAEEYHADEANEPEVSEAEEVSEVEEDVEASTTDDAEEDDETGEDPAESKTVSYGRLKALLDEREKRQAATAKAEALQAALDAKEAELAQMQRQTALSAAQNLPNPHDDPTGYAQALAAKYEEQLIRQALGFSLQNAVGKYGEDETTAAAQWFERQIAANPSMPLRENMLSQSDPMEYVVSNYKQSRKMAALASGDVSALVLGLQKAGYTIQKSEPETAPAVTPTATAPIAKAPAPTAPAAPRRSKLAATSSATTAAPASLSMMDVVTRR